MINCLKFEYKYTELIQENLFQSIYRERLKSTIFLTLIEILYDPHELCIDLPRFPFYKF